MSVEIVSFGNVPEAIAEGNEQALLELVTNVTAQAKALAPVDTGQLRGSIMGQVKWADYGHQEGPMLNENPREGEGYVGSAVGHSVYNEFGTRKIAAQPFLRPAVASEANGIRAQTIVKKFQADSVRKGMRKGPRKKRTV